MKKANNIISKIFLLVNVVCLFTFNFMFASCGLDVFYVINSPIQMGTTLDENTEFPDRYFQFITSEESNDTAINIKGTDVYYKIYDDLSKLKSEVSYINNTDNYSSSKDKLTSSSIQYNPLRARNVHNSVLIPKEGVDGTDRRVRIRLTDYYVFDETSYTAGISVEESPIGIPVRNVPNRYSFNFGRSGNNDKMPVSDDEDAYITSSSNTDFYVALFAVTVAFDSAYTSYFSEPTYLGYIKIDSKSENN